MHNNDGTYIYCILRTTTIVAHLAISMSTNLNARDEYVALKTSMSYPPSPPLSRHSQDSNDSLRALETSEGPANPQRIGR